MKQLNMTVYHALRRPNTPINDNGGERNEQIKRVPGTGAVKFRGRKKLKSEAALLSVPLLFFRPSLSLAVDIDLLLRLARLLVSPSKVASVCLVSCSRFNFAR